MTELEKSVLIYLKHTHVTRQPGCTCARDSWAPCGGQYEGRFAPDCPVHAHPASPTVSHYPTGCWGYRHATLMEGH